MRRGNLAVAVIRMLILLARSRKSVRRDRLERSNEMLTEREPFASLGEVARTRIIHQQTLIAEFEPEQALATLPLLLPDPADRLRAIQLCEYVAGTREEMAPETREVFDRLRKMLEIPAASPSAARARRLSRATGDIPSKPPATISPQGRRRRAVPRSRTNRAAMRAMRG
jgi:hypothetical protein